MQSVPAIAASFRLLPAGAPERIQRNFPIFTGFVAHAYPSRRTESPAPSGEAKRKSHFLSFGSAVEGTDGGTVTSGKAVSTAEPSSRWSPVTFAESFRKAMAKWNLSGFRRTGFPVLSLLSRSVA